MRIKITPFIILFMSICSEVANGTNCLARAKRSTSINDYDYGISTIVVEEPEVATDCCKKQSAEDFKKALNAISSKIEANGKSLKGLKESSEKTSESVKQLATEIEKIRNDSLTSFPKLTNTVAKILQKTKYQDEALKNNTAINDVLNDLNQKLDNKENLTSGTLQQLLKTLDDLKNQTAILEKPQVEPEIPKVENFEDLILSTGKYFFSTNFVTANFTEANTLCAEKGGQLASILTSDELALIASALKDKITVPKVTSFWLGLSDFDNEPGDFRWLNGQKLAQESEWWEKIDFAGQPNNFGYGYNACGAISTIQSKLYDFNCSTKKFFLCKE